MRKEPFAVGDYVHIYNRGNRKLEIVRDANDRWHFLQMLYYFNTESTPENPFRDLRDLLKSDFNSRLIWPKVWGERQPIVSILAFALMENHFHLLLKEEREGGVTRFMRRLGVGMTNRFNKKYGESGRLFQGSYKARRIEKDSHLEYVSVYVQVKNPFELYKNNDLLKSNFNRFFDEAWGWASGYPYCSLGDYATKRQSPLINKDMLGEIYLTPAAYKKLANDCIVRMNLDEKLKTLDLEG